jgi:quinoprotein glucose dehydrogenase
MLRADELKYFPSTVPGEVASPTPIVTAGGLVFIAATVFDRKFRAFDDSTGKLLWETELPFSGLATPATYMVNGKQYVAIAASGGKDGVPAGGVYVAFALP